MAKRGSKKYFKKKCKQKKKNCKNSSSKWHSDPWILDFIVARCLLHITLNMALGA